MGNLTIRTSQPDSAGGNLDDVQITFRVDAIDENGVSVYHDYITGSSKGLKHDPVLTAEWSQTAAEQWAVDRADQIAAGIAKADAKAPERAAVAELLAAIEATPDIVKPIDDVIVKGDAAIEAGTIR